VPQPHSLHSPQQRKIRELALSRNAHDLGNLLIAISFCLKHLRGCQRTSELEDMVERALHDAEQGIEATRSLVQATRALLQMTTDEAERAALMRAL
jgi:metal-sulfur cluster biosynthetic enzyme